MTFLCWLLMWLEAIFGLKVNLNKNELIPVGRVENVDDLACELGCKVVVCRILTWGCHWVLLLTPWQLGMALRKDSAKGWPCGSGNISLRVGELH